MIFDTALETLSAGFDRLLGIPSVDPPTAAELAQRHIDAGEAWKQLPGAALDAQLSDVDVPRSEWRHDAIWEAAGRLLELHRGG